MKAIHHLIPKKKVSLRGWHTAGILIVIMFIAQIPEVHPLFVWDRIEIQNGQWWRIFTGNLTHTNMNHLGMNIAGLLLITWLHASYYEKYAVGLMIWIMMGAIGLALFLTPFDWYVGFSGVLHGLFVWGVVKDIQQKVPLGWLMLFAILAKLTLDVINKGDSMTAALIEANVAYQAHWIGAFVGFLFAMKPKKT